MHEILFKGKRKDTGKWIEGDVHLWGPDAFIFSALDFPDGPDWYEVDPATVGQYGGWNDRHRRKVFEWDVVRGFNDLHERWEIYIVKYAFNNGYYLVDDCGTEWHPKDVKNQEVIGNIHDNPELLGGDEDG